MKKLMSIITCMALCVMMVMPVSAAEITPVDNTVVSSEYDNGVMPLSTNYFTGSTSRMNSLNGVMSGMSKISSGSISVGNPSVTSVSLNVTVSSGSSSFYLYVVSPSGKSASKLVRSSGTVTFSEFNGEDPTGSWYVYIITTGTVSTATARMTVNYSY